MMIETGRSSLNVKFQNMEAKKKMKLLSILHILFVPISVIEMK